MAAKYRVIQNPVIDSELRPSTPDLVLGGRTTGILGGRKTSQSLYYANFLTSNLITIAVSLSQTMTSSSDFGVKTLPCCIKDK